MLGAHKGYTRTHQVIADARPFGGGLRPGTIEVTRYGMGEPEMEAIADFMACAPIEKQSPDVAAEDVIEFRQGYRTLYHNLGDGLPPHPLSQHPTDI